jgi:hypothetical protein
MDAQTALTLERDDVILYQSQLYRFTVAFARGYMLRLRGQHMSPEVLSAKCQLVYRQAEVPPGFTVTPLNDEQEAMIRGVIAERLRREQAQQAQTQQQQEGEG